MPRFFLDIANGDGYHRDETGDEFADFEEACDHTQALLAEVAQDKCPGGRRFDIMCELRNESGRIIYRAQLMLRAEQVVEAATPEAG